MIIKPILPIWLMAIISLVLIVITIWNKNIKDIIKKKDNEIRTDRQKKIMKDYIINILIKSIIAILLFVINLRIMLPNGEQKISSTDLDILFVIDTSVSMRALDYDGTKERFEGVINDCIYMVEQLQGNKFSIISFGDTAKKLIPFTKDVDMTIAELKAVNIENDVYANGTSLNIVKTMLRDTLKNEYEKNDKEAKIILFFISDGEITVDRRCTFYIFRFK